MALTRLARVSALALALAASFELAAAPAFAQRYQDSTGTAVPGFVPITPGVGPQGTTSNPTHVTGSLTASFAGFTQSSSTAFATGTTSASDQNVALPTGTEFIVTNTGANALAYNIGGAATGTMNVLQPNSWVAFANTAAAAFHYIEATGAGVTTFSIVGGAGVPTGAGSGGGSTAGGATSALQTPLNASAVTIATNTGTTATNTSVLNGLGTNGTGNGLTITCTNCSGGGGGGSGSGGSTPQTTAGGAINVSTAATTKLITGISGQYTYITAYNFVAAGTTNVSLEYGSTTSNPCDTSAVVIDGPVALTAQAGKGQGSGLGTVLPPIPQGKDVCIVNSAAIQVGGSLNYTQSTTLAGSFGGGGGGSSSPFASNGNYVNLPSITSISANSSLPSGGGTAILMSNYGSNAIMVALSSSGASTVTAATADDIIPANSTHSIGVGSSTNIAFATLTGSSSLQITGGAGQFTGAGGGGGGSSSSSSADQRLTAIGALTAVDTAANFTTGANGQSVITWSSVPTANSHAEFGGFSGVQTGLLICAGTFTGTFEFDTMMDNASPSKYLKQTIELSGGGAPDKISSFTGPVMGRVSLDGAIGGRIRATATPTGTPVCTLNLTSNLHEIHISNMLPAGKTTNIGLSTSTTGASLVAGVAGQSIRVSAWDAISAGTTNLSIGWSASTSCTSITKLAGPYPLVANAGIARGDGVASIITAPAGDTLCIISDGAVAVGGSVQTTQF